MSHFTDACSLLTKQFGKDTLMSLATSVQDEVAVRIIDAYYKEGYVYIVTHKQSAKVPQIAKNPQVALCKDLFNAKGVAENIGHPLAAEHVALRDELREVFSAFYDAHVNEKDPDTCLLKIKLTWALVFDDNNKYIVDFTTQTAQHFDFQQNIVIPTE